MESEARLSHYLTLLSGLENGKWRWKGAEFHTGIYKHTPWCYTILDILQNIESHKSYTASCQAAHRHYSCTHFSGVVPHPRTRRQPFPRRLPVSSSWWTSACRGSACTAETTWEKLPFVPLCSVRCTFRCAALSWHFPCCIVALQ